jgi:hypothetical protein
MERSLGPHRRNDPISAQVSDWDRAEAAVPAACPGTDQQPAGRRTRT